MIPSEFRCHPCSRFGGGACLLALVVACANPLAPTYIELPLQQLHVDEFYSVIRDSGLIGVAALPADMTYRIGAGERVRVQVAASSGDSETVDLEKEVCEPGPYLCTSLTLAMREGHVAHELLGLLESIPARLWLVSTSGRSAGIRVFDSRDVRRAEEMIRARASVSSVGKDVLFSAGGPGTSAFSRLFGAAPVDHASVVRGDHHIQGAPGDTVRFSYVQPSGDTLECHVVLR